MLEAIYEELKRMGSVETGAEFSERWLGMEQSYFRGLHSKQRDPSTRALATCAVRLKTRARLMKHSTYEQAQLSATMYERLADSCVDALLSACESQ